jgi:AbrB family looped-hinge helix DNA binding protein
MSTLSTTKMSSKGQVVIPEEIRKRLDLKPGARFVVVGEEDVVILKAITQPSLSDFDDLIGEARKQARVSEITKSDIKEVIKEVRSKN